jgi:Na+-driven multidrug efflux pump
VVKASGVKRIRADRELDRRIAALALPALGSIAAEPAYSLADTAILGRRWRAQFSGYRHPPTGVLPSKVWA